MRNKKKQHDSSKIIIIIAAILLIAAAVAVCFVLLPRDTKKEKEEEKEPYIAQQDFDPANHPYTKDVYYQGPIKYMELYDYPFQKTDSYKKNKDLEIGTELAADKAKEFAEKLYTQDYRNLASNPGTIEGIIKEYTDENGVFYPEAGPAGGDDFVDALEYAENLTDYYVTNSISTEASFITNASMVFEDGYVYCRGVLELKSFGGDANTITCLPMEIMMKQAGELDFEIVGIMPVEGYAEFEFERPSGDAE